MAYYLAIEGFVYLIGASFYVTRTPERHWPEMFDIWVSRRELIILDPVTHRL